MKMSEIKWFELTFKQLTPMHIGKYNYGVIAQTHIFIPGYTMWGALVNSYGIRNGSSEEIFKETQDNFKMITCFYPSFDKGNIYFLEYYKGMLYYKEHNSENRYSEKEFRAKFTDTYISTAVIPDTKTAKDESLHEIETILNRSKDERDNSKQLYWKGLIGLLNDKYEKFLSEGLEIFVGGDIRYGFGKMILESKKPISGDHLKEWQINNDGILIKSDKPLTNYVESKNVKLKKGRFETIVHLDFAGAVPSLEKNEKNIYVCFVPGSKVEITDDIKLRLNKGIFESGI
ncbi:RAMP superfamily CRISPR-associated protein [Thermoanaerobacter siderophilus]|nr:RAMP superfamily CRISPR-associated protein [Thermoanaerobacter siderophilus]